MRDKLTWVKVADFITELSFASNGIAEVIADGKTICISKYQGEYFAFAYKCPHASGLLVTGYIDAFGNVVCPLHRYKFCIKNGRNVTGEGYYLKHWPVAIREDGVFVGFEKNKLLGLF